MLDYWGADVQPVCPILERSMVYIMSSLATGRNICNSVWAGYPPLRAEIMETTFRSRFRLRF